MKTSISCFELALSLFGRRGKQPLYKNLIERGVGELRVVPIVTPALHRVDETVYFSVSHNIQMTMTYNNQSSAVVYRVWG